MAYGLKASSCNPLRLEIGLKKNILRALILRPVYQLAYRATPSKIHAPPVEDFGKAYYIERVNFKCT